MRALIAVVAEVFSLTENKVAVAGHVRARPIVMLDSPVWNLSQGRADATRELLQASGLSADRAQRVTGHADRRIFADDPMAVRNNRIEVILLRSDLPL